MGEQPFKDMVLAPESLKDIVEVAFRRAKAKSIKRMKGPLLDTLKRRTMERIKTITECTSKRLRRICFSVPRIEELHPFYREWAQLIVDVDEFRKQLAHVFTAARIVESIGKEELSKLRKASSPAEVRRINRSFVGRYFSVMRSIEETLKSIREKQTKLVKLQNIDPFKPTVVIAGPPNVGKSSLVRALSRAKPEVREYPFTTKELTVGHVRTANGTVIQIIDTPGLLDRPLEERNPVERKAILAIKYLASLIIFMIDPTETCGFPLSYQLDVLRDVLKSFGNTPIIVVLNKLDIADEEAIKKARTALLKEFGIKDVLLISATQKVNVDKVMLKVLAFLKFKPRE